MTLTPSRRFHGVPHVQKGAALIVRDQNVAIRVATTVLALGLFATAGRVARAADQAPVAPNAAPAPAAAAPQSSVTVVEDGAESNFITQAHTVRDVIDERGIHLLNGDFVSPGLASAVTDGTRIVVRTAIPVYLCIGRSTRTIVTADTTVGDVLRGARVRLGREDEVAPPLRSQLIANETIEVVRVRTWIAHERSATRDKTVRFTARDGDAPTRTILSSRVVYPSLARVAAQGFASAVRIAGSALHMIATAYTAGCYGCSGITASGVRAGFGIIAVDPSVIPLGTKVFIPGYGRAVAGDTGGAIQGHRVDLGFDSESAAIQFGRRPVTLYVLR
jgi:3D (Asp-Asp-Asp) domain-containing protein